MKTVHKGLILAILAIAQFMVVLDASIVNVALPSIMESLNFSPENLQWIVTAYTLSFGGFLLFGGRAADLFGRRKIFLIGLVGFTLASMFVGLAQNEVMMIIGRAIQGLAAAFMSPAALSIVLTEFKEGPERNKALGVWSAVAAGGAAAGLLLGGALTQYLGWEWDFFINVPVGIVLAILAIKYVPLHESTADHKHLDLPGAVLVTGGLMTLVYAFSKAPEWGWSSATTIWSLIAAVVILAAFVFNESRSKHPLMPLSIFKIRNLSGANLTQLPVTAAMFSMFFFVSLYAQEILGFTPLQTGLAFLPFTVVVAIVSTNISRFFGKIGYKPFMVAGPVFIAIALFFLSNISVDGNYFTQVLPGIALLAFGASMCFVSISIAATSGVPQHESGLASGLLNTAQQVGGALGLAILSGIAATTSANVIADGTAKTMEAATVTGFSTALLVGAFFAIAAALIALFVIKQVKGEKIDTSEVVASH
jgi:EmrB/QacA subfamily drug resistance transporter